VVVDPENLLVLLLVMVDDDDLDCNAGAGEIAVGPIESDRRDFLIFGSPVLDLSNNPLMAFSNTDFLKEELRSKVDSDSNFGLLEEGEEVIWDRASVGVGDGVVVGVGVGVVCVAVGEVDPLGDEEYWLKIVREIGRLEDGIPIDCVCDCEAKPGVVAAGLIGGTVADGFCCGDITAGF